MICHECMRDLEKKEFIIIYRNVLCEKEDHPDFGVCKECINNSPILMTVH